MPRPAADAAVRCGSTATMPAGTIQSSKCNEFATRFGIRFAAVSRLSRAVSRLVSRVSHRVFREFRGCLAAVS
eukprot:850197-Prymnesium_polylepis.1